ncbi:MAG: O-sialoglycoprotein endopeptidase [Bacillota bacterium]|nr:O-sialoglycoprotein endopeptidase [Bacillota bacterium]
MYFLGIDTSNYVTSMAIVRAEPEGIYRLHWEKRIILEVIKGGKGLRQAEAVFQHVRNMPLLWEEAARHLPEGKLYGIAASTRPRPAEGSYMPVFQAGTSFAESAAFMLKVPYYAYSHQEGHLLTGLWSSGCGAEHFLALHLSGGTTEAMLIKNRAAGNLEIKLLGGTTDLNAGQFVDRAGVKLGFSFPAGKELEALAARSKEGGIKVPVSVNRYDVSFSGPATFVERAIDKSVPGEEVARGVEICLAHSFLEVLRNLARDTEIVDVLVVGGIAANAFVRRRLVEGLPSLNFFFPAPSFAGDSAIGPALLSAYNRK